jgi:hypothetical protein
MFTTPLFFSSVLLFRSSLPFFFSYLLLFFAYDEQYKYKGIGGRKRGQVAAAPSMSAPAAGESDGGAG